MFTPSPYQEAIFREFASGTGHLVIVARAGSGKTTTLIEGLNYLAPCRRLLCAFNTEIRDELSYRAGTRAKVMTLHGLGLSTLMRSPLYRGAEKDDAKGFRLARAAIKQLGVKFRSSDEEEDTVQDVVKAASLAKATLTKSRPDLVALIEEHALDTPEFPAARLAEIVAVAVKAAIDDKQHIDYDDMIWLPNLYNMNPPSYDQVIVDEAQDMSFAQLQLAMRACTGRFIAVGDPAQAIYGWRGADSSALDRVIAELRAPVLPLSVSYRCPKKVVEHVRRFVPDIEAAPNAAAGVLDTMTLEATLRRVQPGDYVLSRSNAPLVDVCMALTKMKTPARIVGRDAGQSLLKLVRKSKAENVNGLLAFLEQHEEGERTRLADRPEAFGKAVDQIEALRSLAEAEPGIREIYAKIDRFFTDKMNPGSTVACSTVHKAKGKERDRVFLLRETFFRYDGPEEQNVYYVAATRARRELHLVTGLYNE